MKFRLLNVLPFALFVFALAFVSHAQDSNPPKGNFTKVEILGKPLPAIPNQTRNTSIQGQIVLRIEFLASGEIGKITPISKLSYGLTEAAIEAARKIKFKPATRRAIPVTVNLNIQYAFEYNGWRKELDSKPSQSIEETVSAECTISLNIEFLSSGKIGKVKVVSNMCNSDKALEKSALESAKAIKFEPAIKNGKKIAETKTMEYRFNLVSESEESDR